MPLIVAIIVCLGWILRASLHMKRVLADELNIIDARILRLLTRGHDASAAHVL